MNITNFVIPFHHVSAKMNKISIVSKQNNLQTCDQFQDPPFFRMYVITGWPLFKSYPQKHQNISKLWVHMKDGFLYPESYVNIYFSIHIFCRMLKQWGFFFWKLGVRSLFKVIKWSYLQIFFHRWKGSMWRLWLLINSNINFTEKISRRKNRKQGV